jgi:cold shock CspA family protein
MAKQPILLVRGRVSYLNPRQNYGFIKLLGSGEEVFFHRQACGDPWGLEDFKIGDRVVFHMFRVKVRGGKKLRGFDVQKMDSKKERVR